MDTPIIPQKHCATCKEPFPETRDYFYYDKTHKRLSARCKACIRQWQINKARNNGTPAADRSKIVNGEKRCSKCKEMKSISDFPKDSTDKRGIKSYCILCSRLIANRHYHDDREAILTRRRANYKANPKRLIQLSINYQNRNRGARQNYLREYRRNNPEKGLEHFQRRRARKHNLPATFTAQDWRHAIAHFNGVCAYCGNPPSLFDNHKVLQREHHIPLSEGGGYTPGNIVPACQSCNLSKKDNDPAEWCLEKFGKHKGRKILNRIRAYFNSLKES